MRHKMEKPRVNDDKIELATKMYMKVMWNTDIY